MLFGFAFLLNVWQELLAALLILSFGWFWGKWRAIVVWKKKEFKNRILIALNTVFKEGSQYRLSLRTLFEKDLYDVLQDERMVRLVEKAIDEATEENPILKFQKEDSWYILNSVLNKIAEQFATWTIRRDMGLGVNSKWYTFCMTFEKEGGVKMHKIRVMLIQKDILANFPDEGEILLESGKHTTRVKTLRLMKKELQENPHLFMHLELYQ
ncbi:MAG: hypothetical protein HUU50_16680 [Candidatus Brocadiae bacterium]|nr:hypothetical protein [Candidatus Brocadiia bacterium]